MGKFLGLDYGERRIGVALSDEEGRLVVPQKPIIVERTADVGAAIQRLVAKEQVTGVVVGMPLSLTGMRGPQASVVQDFVCQLDEVLNIPVDIEDERLTSKLAHRGAFPDEEPGMEDSRAAALLLESYLARHTAQKNTPDVPST